MSLSNITTSIFDGKHGDCTNQEGSGLYFISVKDLREYDIDYTDAREITPTDFQQNYSRTNLENGDTIYANTGDTIGKSLFVKDNPLVSKTSFQKSVAILKPNTSVIEPRYLYYLLKYETPRLRKASSGSGQKNLLLSTMRSFEVSVHDRLTQKRIVAVLGAIDDKIRNNIHINDNLQHQLKLLYDYWFTQFDFPDKNGKPYRLSGGAMVWNEQLKRKIPVNWDAIPVSNICELLSGFPFPSELYATNGAYKLITIKNVQDTGINLNVDNWIEDLPSKMPEYCNLKPFDILMSLTGNVGRIGVFYTNNCLLNQRVALVRPFNRELNGFTYFLLKSDVMRKQLETISNGSSQQNLSPIETQKINIAYNPEIARLFSKKANEALKVIVQNLAENESLTNLRDWLLPMLMNGQATIAD